MAPLVQDLCDIRSGYSFRGSVAAGALGHGASAAGHPVVQLGDVDWEAQRISWRDLPRVTDFTPGQHHRLNPGDVLFATRGRALRALVVDGGGTGVVPASTFLILRVKAGDVEPAYVAWYINTATAQAHLKACGQGTNLQSVPKSCLATLPVPVPPLPVQRHVVEVDRLGRLERLDLVELARRRQEYAEALCLSAVNT